MFTDSTCLLNLASISCGKSTSEDNLHVKYNYFRTVCITDYNIGFGAPEIDCCSTCLSLKSEIKHARDLGKNKTLKLRWMFITKKAQAFMTMYESKVLMN